MPCATIEAKQSLCAFVKTKIIGFHSKIWIIIIIYHEIKHWQSDQIINRLTLDFKDNLNEEINVFQKIMTCS